MTVRTVLAAASWVAMLMASPSTAGTLEERNFASAAIGGGIPATIYLPDRAEGPLPVLYLLHGYGGNERDWVEAGVVATADAVFAEPGSAPMLIVMPAAGNSWYVESARYGDWDRAIARELPAAVDAAYPTDRHRAARFVAGLSMGGYGALRLAVHHPGRFRAAAALSPAIFEDIEDASAFPDFQIEFFAGAFGDPLSPAAFNARNVFEPLPTLGRAARAEPTSFYLMTGDHDGFGLWRGTLRFFEAARQSGIAAELRVHDGDHDWRLWRDELAPVLRWIAGIMRTDRGLGQ